MIDSIVFPAMQALLECLREKLAANPDPPKYHQLRVGRDPIAADFDQYFDYCCEGIAYIRLGRRFPSGANFPERDELASNCQPEAWGVDLDMGVMRCVPAGDRGLSMDPEAWFNATYKNQNDQQAMTEAMCCWVDNQGVNNPYFWKLAIRDGFPLSNQGGCSGFEWQVTAQFGACDPCAPSGGFGIQPFSSSAFGV